MFVPEPHQFYEAKSNDTDFTNVIINNVKCELHKGVQDIVAPSSGTPNNLVQWLRTWGSKVDLKFTVDEMSSLNPGAAFKPPPPFSWGLGLGGSAHATRDEDISFTYAFKDLLAQGRINKCDNENGILIQSDLQIGDWIAKHVQLATIPGTIPGTGMPSYDTVTYTLTFVASYSANATPTWTFKHVTVDPSGSLISLSRSKTSTLILTLSPAAPATDNKPATLNPDGLTAHNAAVIGQAVGVANQSTMP
ncbi:MAG TPA: hypothetical protein VMF32_04235 [Xanthobacteraceae bacterium]|nr:hypothetical protein [Xanthobacteraceae bacterium]